MEDLGATEDMVDTEVDIEDTGVMERGRLRLSPQLKLNLRLGMETTTVMEASQDMEDMEDIIT